MLASELIVSGVCPLSLCGLCPYNDLSAVCLSYFIYLLPTTPFLNIPPFLTFCCDFLPSLLLCYLIALAFRTCHKVLSWQSLPFNPTYVRTSSTISFLIQLLFCRVNSNDAALKVHKMKLFKILDNIVCECNERYFTHFNVLKEEHVRTILNHNKYNKQK